MQQMQPLVISTRVSSRTQRPRALGAHALGVDVHLGHIVDDDGDPHPLAVAERMVEQRGLPGAEEARQDGDGQSGRHGSHGSSWHAT